MFALTEKSMKNFYTMGNTWQWTLTIYSNSSFLLLKSAYSENPIKLWNQKFASDRNPKREEDLECTDSFEHVLSAAGNGEITFIHDNDLESAAKSTKKISPQYTLKKSKKNLSTDTLLWSG